MDLRKLELKDAPLMLEWMQDDSTVQYLRGDYAKWSLSDCISFIESSRASNESVHMAIMSDEDEYMGTVSLNDIKTDDMSAELSIITRKAARGRGYAWIGMQKMIQYAFEKLDLENVYWCVNRTNLRAIRFFDKHNFNEAIDIPETLKQKYSELKDLKWYSVIKGDVLDDRTNVAGCSIVHIRTVPTIGAGKLSFFEADVDIPFEIRRVYYISKVPEGVRRGYHAHKELKQLLFCPYGRIQLVLENEFGREEIELSDPSIGVVIDRPTWREMLWLQKDSVLCVAASEHYDDKDYIREYQDFRNYISTLQQLKDT